MATSIPRLVEILEEVEDIEDIHPITKPYSTIRHYRTAREKYAILNGQLSDDESETDFATALEPGTLYITNYYIALRVRVHGNIVQPLD